MVRPISSNSSKSAYWVNNWPKSRMRKLSQVSHRMNPYIQFLCCLHIKQLIQNRRLQTPAEAKIRWALQLLKYCTSSDMTDNRSLCAPHTFLLGSRGRHHSLYACLLLVQLTLAARADITGYEAYDTKHKQRCATHYILRLLPCWLQCWSIRFSLALLPRRAKYQITSNPRRFMVGEGGLSTIYHHTRIVRDGLTRRVLRLQRLWRCKVYTSWISNPTSGI